MPVRKPRPESKESTRIGIADVARHAEVSPATVSRILSGGKTAIAYSEATKKKVMEAAAELNYVPNSHARRLVRGRADHVALVVRSLSSPFFGELVDNFVRTFAEFNIRVSVDVVDSSEEATLAAIANFGGEMVDAIFVCPSHAAMSFEEIKKVARCPVITLVHKPQDATVPYVAFDMLEAAREGTQYLIQLGRKRIGYVGSTDVEDGRFQGYRAALKEAGMAADPTYVIDDYLFMIERAERAGARLAALPVPPDALFVVCDISSMGVIRGLKKAGLSVPEDVAVVSHDGIQLGAYFSPTLTSMAIPWHSMSTQCVSILKAIHARKSERDLLALSRLLSSSLIIRESSGVQATAAGRVR